MKNKKYLIIGVILLIIVFVFFIIKKQTKKEEDKVKTVSDISVIEESKMIEEVDFSNYEIINVELNESYEINKGGVYNLSGEIQNGQIYIDTKDNVKLVLNNVSITNNNGSAIMVENADLVYIELKEDSINYLTDGSNYKLDENEEPNATIFSKDNLVIDGLGKLVIKANYKDGIASKDNLKIVNGIFEIEANDDAIRGKDSLVIENGEFNINAGGDAIKTTNDTDDSLGYIIIKNGNYNLISTNDGIQAETDILIENGTFNIETGDGSENSSSNNDDWGIWRKPNQQMYTNDDTESAKAIKATNNIIIENGEFNIDSSDDSIHSNEYVGIKLGIIQINSGDDGIHADNEVIIDGGNIIIEKSYEGIEAESITINNGKIKIIASDDGMNAAGGNDSSSMNGRPGMNDFEGNGNAKIQINNGNIYIDASGDGIDANGNIYMNDGIVIVNGPTNSGNGSLDYDKEFKITGGTFIASGSSGMAQGASNTSTQNTIMINFSNTIKSGTIISILDINNNEIITYEASKNYNNIVISSPNLEKGKTCTLYTSVNTTKENINGLYELGGYNSGTEYTSFTINSVITNIGNYMGGMNQGGMNPGMQQPPGRR